MFTLIWATCSKTARTKGNTTGRDDILTFPRGHQPPEAAVKEVYGLAQKGDLPAFKVGGQWRFRRAAIESWIEENTEATGGIPSGTARNPPTPTKKADGHEAIATLIVAGAEMRRTERRH